MCLSGYATRAAHSLWPASWLPAVGKSMGSKSVVVQRVWEIYDERPQFMSRHDAVQLDESLGADDVFLFSRNSRDMFWGLFFFWHLWIGRARHPGPTSLLPHVGVEVLDVGGWLTHGDLALGLGLISLQLLNIG